MSALDQAGKRLDAAYANVTAAAAEDASARAELVRLQLLELAAKSPTIEAFTFQVTFEYDDEGGYWPSVTVSAVWPDATAGEDAAYDEIEDELIEVGNMLTQEAAELIAGGPAVMGEAAAHKTIDELKAASF